MRFLIGLIVGIENKRVWMFVNQATECNVTVRKQSYSISNIEITATPYYLV